MCSVCEEFFKTLGEVGLKLFWWEVSVVIAASGCGLSVFVVVGVLERCGLLWDLGYVGL